MLVGEPDWDTLVVQFRGRIGEIWENLSRSPRTYAATTRTFAAACRNLRRSERRADKRHRSAAERHAHAMAETRRERAYVRETFGYGIDLELLRLVREYQKPGAGRTLRRHIQRRKEQLTPEDYYRI